jgi:hypothetical protein
MSLQTVFVICLHIAAGIGTAVLVTIFLVDVADMQQNFPF